MDDKNSEISKAYAKAVFLLGEENNIDIISEFLSFNDLINKNQKFETFLFSGIYTLEEKEDVIKHIFKKSSYSSLFKNFMIFLIDQKRLNLFPLVFKNVIVIDDDKKGFIRGTIHGMDDKVNVEFLNKIVSYLEKKINKSVKLEYKKDTTVGAGYRVLVDNLQLDASLDHQLENIRKSVSHS